MGIEKCIALITQQQPKEQNDVWGVGEQLKDILRRSPELAELVETDLSGNGMTLADCAKKIKEYADEQHKKNKGSCIFVPPSVAEGIIRKFYGLPEQGEAPTPAPETANTDGMIDLEAFL